MPSRTLWTKEELLIALNLYHKLAFGQMHARQPLIVEVAQRMGRSANSLAMKLVNLASLDPVLKLRGIRGLSGASRLDQETWTAFHDQIHEMAATSEEALRKLYVVPEESEIDVLPEIGVRIRRPSALTATETRANLKVRRGQAFFREAVLNNFNGQCGVSRLDLRELLVASHILPWATYPSQRLNVANGLCLSRLHDAAFDQGLITFGEDLKLILSARLRSRLGLNATESLFGRHEGSPLHLPPDAMPPSPEFLAWHRRELFVKAA